jgi:tRNA U38,U39,U40 pseudouridine synthase TruA
MSNTTATARQIGENFAAAINSNTIDIDFMEAAQTDAGVHVDGFIVWHRTEDNTVAVWAGNNVDPDMNSLVEVPVDVR